MHLTALLCWTIRCWIPSNVVSGLKPDGIVVINSKDKPDDIDLGKEIRTGAVDATSVALEILKAPITNTAILEPCKGCRIVKIESIEEAIKRRFGEKLGAKVANEMHLLQGLLMIEP